MLSEPKREKGTVSGIYFPAVLTSPKCAQIQEIFFRAFRYQKGGTTPWEGRSKPDF